MTHFRYTPSDYDAIWNIALKSNAEATIAKVREIYQKDPTTLENGGTPDFVGRDIWESAQEYMRPPTLEEVDILEETTESWKYLSCEKGLVSWTVRKLIEHYRKTYKG